MNDWHAIFMKEAIRLAVENAENGYGPFGTVISSGKEIISRGTNRVIQENDPTAHAEIIAIRRAGLALGRFDLGACTLYSSCEPCPMCLGAIYWARIPVLYFGSSKDDAAKYGFDDEHIYQEINLPGQDRQISMIRLLSEEALEAFRKWDENPGKRLY